MLQVNISGEVESILNEVVLGDEKAKIDFVMKALLVALEDAEDLRAAEKAHAEWAATGYKTYTFEEVMKENGLL